MKKIDWGTFEWVLSQPNLKLTWHLGCSASGDERLDTAPIEAYFFWERGSEIVWDLELTRDKLVTVIQELESKDLEAPKEFHDAFQEWKI